MKQVYTGISLAAIPIQRELGAGSLGNYAELSRGSDHTEIAIIWMFNVNKTFQHMQAF